MFSFPVCHWSSSALSSIIVSIQQFDITIATSATSNTATISSVTTGNAVIFFNGFTTTHTSTTLREFMPRVELTNATTVTAYRDTSSASFTVTCRGTVVEFAAGALASAVQQGTITVASGNTSGMATISSVTTSRACVFYLGVTNSTTTTAVNAVHVGIDLTNATTVTATRNTSNTAVLTVGYAVVELASSVIQSIQKRAPTFTSSGTSSTDTISAVTTANTILINNGLTTSTLTQSAYFYYFQLTNSTTATFTRTGTATATKSIYYTVLEFAPGIISSNQQGATIVTAATSADSTITAVNTSKSVCNYCSFSTDGSTTDRRFATNKLFNTTTVRAEKNTASTTSTVGYEVIEFL